MLETLVQLAPGRELAEVPAVPPSRVVLEPAAEEELKGTVDPFQADSRYYEATVKSNRRITAEGWNQDVRHFEFEFEDDIR